jgi:hypothetical protein
MKQQASILLFWLLLTSPLCINGQGSQPTVGDGERHSNDGSGSTPNKSSNEETNPTINPVVKYWSKFVAARRTSTQFAYTGSGDHENAGIYTEGGGAYLGVEATHTVFKNGDFNLELPPGAQGVQTLFAPTTRPPNGSCLEMGTAYTKVIGRPTSVHVYVYDFCKSPKRFIYAAIVDDNFLRMYAGESLNGIHAYKIRIKPDGQSLTNQTKWSAMIYDYTKRDWVTIGVSQGFVTSDRNGWSIFETWYKKGQCSRTLKKIEVVNIAYYNAITDSWEPILEKMLPLRNSLHHGGDCFMDQDADNRASYEVNELQPLHGWQVVGTGH